MGGSAGAILGLLRLYRDSQSSSVLKRATKCGEHLLALPRRGGDGRRTWINQRGKALNGISHGAAGYAYALASLAAATGRAEFAAAAAECIAFENSSYDVAHANWPDFRPDNGPLFPCQWCHGASGIGLSRIAMIKRGACEAKFCSNLSVKFLTTDINNALVGAERNWPGQVDTMCCGTLSSIEFFYEAGNVLARSDLRDTAAHRLAAILATAESTGDYQWNTGSRQFNVGLFRGLAGVGYTCLRQIDPSLPNILIWE